MLGRRGKADPGRHPVRAAPEAAENRFGVCQEQEIDGLPPLAVCNNDLPPVLDIFWCRIGRRAGAVPVEISSVGEPG
eukprot:COSAG05_NODE_24547_length_250_cov_84.198675_1_plen_76_part_01